MASWKLVIVSGSSAELASVTSSNGILVGSNQAITTSPSTSFLSGSFSGSFVGDGSGLSGMASSLDISGSDGSSGTVDLLTQDLTITGGEGIDTAVSGQTVTISGEDASDTNKGIASFNSTNFTVSSGNVTSNNLTVTAGSGLSGGGAFTLGGSTALTVDSGSLVAYYSGSIFSTVSGDITINNTGTASISADAVELGTNTTGNYVASITGTTNEIEVTGGSGEGSTPQIGLPNDVIINNNLTVGGNLSVNGDLTYVNTANLLVEDAFILLASGSSGTGDSGIIFGGSEGVAQSGSALFWDADYNGGDGRLSIANGVAQDATSPLTSAYSVAGVFEGTEGDAAIAEADHPGNIRIESGEVYIYV